MLITRNKYARRITPITVFDISIGQPFIFMKTVHQKHKLDDIFIRVESPRCYLNLDGSLTSKVLCVNLRTGDLAAISNQTECKHVIASVLLHDD